VVACGVDVVDVVGAVVVEGFVVVAVAGVAFDGEVVLVVGAVVVGVEGVVDFVVDGDGDGVEDEDPLLPVDDAEPLLPVEDVEPLLPVDDVDVLVDVDGSVVPPVDDDPVDVEGSVPDVVPDEGSVPDVVPDVGSVPDVVPDDGSVPVVVPDVPPVDEEVPEVRGVPDPDPDPAEEMTTVSSAPPTIRPKSCANERLATKQPCRSVQMSSRTSVLEVAGAIRRPVEHVGRRPTRHGSHG
jgi:hypothetical protein